MEPQNSFLRNTFTKTPAPTKISEALELLTSTALTVLMITVIYRIFKI